MHRTYTAEKYIKLVDEIRTVTPEMAMTTDIIVGFPGETDEDFQSTKALVDRVGFDNAFVFKYSKRKDTPAASVLDQVPDRLKEERNQELLALVNDWARRRNAGFIGREVEVLCEGPSKTNPARLMGRTRGNKIVVFEGASRHLYQLLNIRITHASGYTLYGEPVPVDAGTALGRPDNVSDIASCQVGSLGDVGKTGPYRREPTEIGNK